MELRGVSSLVKSQNAYGKQNSEEPDNGSGGWKYLTVREGGRIYTYLVIGKNMRILIGEKNAEEKSGDKDGNAAEGSSDVGGGVAQASDRKAASVNADMSVSSQKGGKEEQEIRHDFLLDTSMLGLTAYHQKKMRETIKHLGNSIGNNLNGNAISDSAEKTKE